MTVQPEQDSASVTRCWCCGGIFPQSELVRLGQHPEVGVCLAKESLAESAQHLKEEVKSDVHDAADEVKQTASDATSTTSEHAKASAQEVADHGREATREVKS